MRIDICKYPKINNYNCNNYVSKMSSNTNFKGCPAIKSMKNTCMTLSAISLLTAACTNNKTYTYNTPKTDTVEITYDNNTADSIIAQNSNENEKKPVRNYHYAPSEKEVTAEDYSWAETIYPDGKIEKDSMGYKITITPEGERTSVKTETDEAGHTTTTTVLPDGTKVVKTDYKLPRQNEILYTIKTYRPDESLKNSRYYNEYPSDSTENAQRVIEESFEEFNDNDILLRWYSTVKDEARSEDNNEYDNLKRLIYDDVKNETYMYKGQSKTPFQSISKYDDCSRITEYNDDGTIKKIYFKASDGTITEKTDSL